MNIINKDNTITIGATNGTLVKQLGRMSNRHGLIAGATGIDKTITLEVFPCQFGL